MYKNSKILLIIIAFLFIFSIFMPMTVNAETFTCRLCGGQHEVGELDDHAFARLGYNVELIANGTFEDIGEILGETSNRYNMTSILEFDVSGAGEFGPLMSAISKYYNLTVLIGSVIIVLYFFLDLMEISLNDGFTYESLLKHGIKAIIGIAILQNGLTIIGYGISLCNYCFDAIIPPDGSTLLAPIYNGVGDCVYGRLYNPNAIVPVNPLTVVCVLIENLLPCLAVLASYVLLRVIVWVRVFDIAVRIIFAPIGMSDILNGGLQAPGIKYFKKLMASVLNGAVIMGVLLVYQSLRPALIGSLSATVGSIAIGFAVISLTRKTQHIAEEIMGVD